MLREALTLERLGAMPADEAAALFVARNAEGLTAQEEQLLAGWLAADPDHALAYARAGRAWDVFAGAEEDELLAAMRAHALAPPARRRGSWPRLAAVAAMLVLALAASLLILTRQAPSPGGTNGDAALAYATARGQVRTIALPDGSRMTLDAESAAEVRFAGGERAVRLVRGRALFEVHSDPSRPFAVAAGERRIIATGTSFEVDVAPSLLRVTLLEGRVTVGPAAGGAAPVTLRPGQSYVERGGAAVVRTLAANSDTTAWRRGMIDFDDTPLVEAVAEVNRHASDQIVIGDAGVAALRVSGRFRAGEAERFARTVAEVHPVRVVRQGDRIALLPAR